MTVAIIDYGSGNLRSVAKAFERAALDNGLAVDLAVTADPRVVARADRIVLPGVGAFGDCRRGLGAVDGMIEALEQAVIRGGRPFFGICVGMQLMARRGLEHGAHDGLGWIDGEVGLLVPGEGLRVPHMGWNEIRLTEVGSVHPVFAGASQNAHAYFVHSYAMRDVPEGEVLATVDYGGPVVAAVGRDNMIGTQFHPEKSQAFGLGLIARFLQWCP